MIYHTFKLNKRQKAKQIQNWNYKKSIKRQKLNLS